MNVRRIVTTGFLWSGLLWSFASYGQKAPLGTLPIQYNPSFAGEAGGPRLSTNFRLQPGSRATPGHLSELYASYDQFIPAIRSGIGITAGWGNTFNKGNFSYPNFFGNYDVKSTDRFLSVAIAPKFSLKGKYTLSPSIDFSYQHASLSSRTTQISTDSSFIINPTTGGYYYNYDRWQSRVGLLFNTSKLYIGYSVRVFARDIYHTQPEISKAYTYSSTVRPGFLSYLQVGYSYQRTSHSKFSFTPQLAVRFAEKSHLLNGNHLVHLEAINLNFKYQQIIFGINNRGGHVGWQTDKLRLMLTNQFGSEYYGGYEGNLSLRLLLKNKAGKNPNLAGGY